MIAWLLHWHASVNMSKEAVEKHINDQKYNEMKKALYRA